jgi:hypothetical protein
MVTARARNLAELGVPGAATGLIAGMVVGALATLVGQPVAWAGAGALTLGLPLALLGGGYGALVAAGIFRPGVFSPVAIYWMVGFPLARLLHESVTPTLLGGGMTPPDDVLTFLAFQALVSMGYAIGFIWLHERLAPYWLMRIKDHNPEAQQVYMRYVEHAEHMWEARERQRARRRANAKRQADHGRQPAAASGAAARATSRRS